MATVTIFDLLQVEGREVALNEVTDEMVTAMTDEERQLYATLCQQAMSQVQF